MTRPRKELSRDFGGARTSLIEPARLLCTDEAVGLVLRQARLTGRLSLEAAAARAMITGRALMAKETGRSPVDASELPEILAAVGLTVDEFERRVGMHTVPRGTRVEPRRRYRILVLASVGAALTLLLALGPGPATSQDQMSPPQTERYWCSGCALP